MSEELVQEITQHLFFLQVKSIHHHVVCGIIVGVACCCLIFVLPHYLYIDAMIVIYHDFSKIHVCRRKHHDDHHDWAGEAVNLEHGDLLPS